MNEAETCRTLVRPKLEAAGWEANGERHYREQIGITAGRIVVAGGIAKRQARIADARRLREECEQDVTALWRSALDRIVIGELLPAQHSGEDARTLLKTQATATRTAGPSKHNNANPGSPTVDVEGPRLLPHGWVWTTLGSVLSHLVDCVNDTPDFADTATGFLGLKSTNVKPYRLDLSQKWYVSESDFAVWNRREAPRPGDIILTREAPMGQSCILPPDVTACLTQRLMLLRTDERFVHNRFVLHYLNSNVFLDQVRDTCRGLTTPHIRVQDAPNLLFPLPPLPEQRRIVAHLDGLRAKADVLRALQAEMAGELDALLPAVLSRAFAGRL